MKTDTVSKADYDDLLKKEHALSDAYVRLRVLIPGALDTPKAPTSEQIYEITEKALKALLARANPGEVR